MSKRAGGTLSFPGMLGGVAKAWLVGLVPRAPDRGAVSLSSFFLSKWRFSLGCKRRRKECEAAEAQRGDPEEGIQITRPDHQTAIVAVPFSGEENPEVMSVTHDAMTSPPQVPLALALPLGRLLFAGGKVVMGEASVGLGWDRAVKIAEVLCVCLQIISAVIPIWFVSCPLQKKLPLAFIGHFCLVSNNLWGL